MAKAKGAKCAACKHSDPHTASAGCLHATKGGKFCPCREHVSAAVVEGRASGRLMTPSDVYGQLWKDPKYVRLNELKDEALRAWNRADAYKHTAAAVPAEELRRKDEAAKRAMRAVHEYERDAFTKAGVSWGFEV